MLKSCQSIYVSLYRWTFKNFGQGDQPRFKSLFNVSFLLIIALTCLLLVMQLMLRSQMITATPLTETTLVFGATFLLLINHFMFLNNKWFKNINARMRLLGRHNPNTWSVVVLVNVILICGFLIFTIG
ncbi:hypothetical protein [Mucilaginibacter ginsenosidivorans]|uniref:Uncharacterized protein n=1 Tax=Mucilaginibacter ginsenosidivorans TaxID=398053 RepID=A0A5B8URL0_9SPHI|nr:hypothetical protein [Mucilaginibacter ginsenosidivorans]QEC61710.1 hypothetical protein FRZ54_03625 [Mucilaginibacter ginsenosidivorans]